MTDKEKEILELIGDNYKTSMSTSTIGYQYYHSYKDIDISFYEHFTVEEFLQLYKINRMLELGVINEKEHKNLVDLFYAKKDLGERLGEEGLKELRSEDDSSKSKYVSKTKGVLSSSLVKIDKVFAKYRLCPDDLELETIMDSLILGEEAEYENKYMSDLDKLDSFTKEMGNLRLYLKDSDR